MNDNQKNYDIEAYTALGISSALYAMVLNTEDGKKFAKDYTWATVVFGTALVLTFARFLLPEKYWRKMVFAFVLSGSPLIARSISNKKKLSD